MAHQYWHATIRVGLAAALITALSTVPQSLASPTIDDFLRAADVRDLELSPDGKHLAMVINSGNTRTVVVRNIEDPAMPVVGSFSEDYVRPDRLYWGNNDRLLISLAVPRDRRRIRRDRERKSDFDINEYAMVSRMIALNKDMSDSVILFEGEHGVRSNSSLSRITNFLPRDKDHILMAAYRNQRRTQYKVNILTGEAEIVVKGVSWTVRFLNDEDGNPLYRFDYLPRSKAIVIYEYRDNDKWKKLDKIYLDKDDEDSIDTAGLVALYEDTLVYRKRNEDTGYYELLSISTETNERETLVSLPDQDVRGALIDSRTDEIVGYSVEKDYVRYKYFDERDQREYDAIAAQIGHSNFSVSGLSVEGKVALITSWGPDDPLSYHLWSMDTQELMFLAHAFQGLASAELSLPAISTYKTRDGQAIRAYILLPKDYREDTRYPTIILPHGGPHARSRASYSDFAQFLSTRGYVVVQPNFRGSVGYGHDFEAAGYKQWGGVMQDDLTDAVGFMVDRGFTDPEKVCIVGISYGGYAALMGAVKTPSLFQCAISLNGVTHLADIVRHYMKHVVDEEDWQPLLFDRIGHPSRDEELLNANSPALNADKITIPIMLVAGTKDTTVPFSQAKTMEKALKRADVDYEFIPLKDTGHNPFYYREDKETVFRAVETFLEANLR